MTDRFSFCGLLVLVVCALGTLSTSGSNRVQGDRAPIVTQWVKPGYPPIAAARNIDGAVLVDVWISPNGDVQRSSVVSGPTLLRKAAKEAAMRWQFNRVEPGTCVRSARLVFIFRPATYIPKETDSDFTPPYQISIVRVAMTGVR